MCAMRIARIALAVGERRWPSIFNNLDASTSWLIWHMVASGSSWCWHKIDTQDAGPAESAMLAHHLPFG